jgi:hypothetical protein
MNIQRSVFWYPFRPWLRWPVRLLAIAGIISAAVKLVAVRDWCDCFRFIFPIGLLAMSFDKPELKPKTPAYFVGAVLAWIAVALTFAFIIFWTWIWKK